MLGFLIYAFSVCAFAAFMIYKIAPVHGKKNPLIYLSICSTVGSVSVMAIKAFGIALKLTFAGNNQFTHPSTYVFMIITAVCILTQMNYFNKALSQFAANMYVSLFPPCVPTKVPIALTFPANSVNPLYYVTFTTATLSASFILFSGFNTTDIVSILTLLCGFLVTFTGVYLLNLSRGDPNGTKLSSRRNGDDITGTDMISSIQTRMSMEARRSMGGRSRNSDRDGLIRAYDEEEAAGFGLTDLADDSDSDMDPRSPMMPSHAAAAASSAAGGPNGNGNGNGHLTPGGGGRKGYNEAIELQNRRSGDR